MMKLKNHPIENFTELGYFNKLSRSDQISNF